MLVLDMSKIPMPAELVPLDEVADEAAEAYAEDVVFSQLVLHVVACAHRWVQRDYTLAVLVHALPLRPSIGWLRRAYSRFDRAYKKNLKLLYLVDASRWLRLLLALSRPFISPKFWRKVHYVARAELNVRPRLSSVSRALEPHRYNAMLQAAAANWPTLLVRLPLVVVGSLRGPVNDQAVEHEAVQTLGTAVAGRTVSTYPTTGAGARMGQPIADHFRVDAAVDGAYIACVADGCGWGRKSSAASDLACSSFVQAVKEELTVTADAAVSLVSIADSLIESLLVADAAIGKGATGPRDECGTTTLCGAVVLPVTKAADAAPSFVVTLVSVGDCKAYLWRASTGAVEDITSGNRPDVGTAQDPGGRLGPAVDLRDADLRNVAVRAAVDCVAGDILLLCSDGVSDNVDPACMNVPVTAADADSWDDVPEQRLRFTLDLLARMIREQHQTRAPAELCAGVADAIVGHCVRVLQPLADFMLAHPDERQPAGMAGKPDHTTVVVIKLGITPLDTPVSPRARPSLAAPAPAAPAAQASAAMDEVKL
jgi:serine/threonine protein phosphatase PrpC